MYCFFSLACQYFLLLFTMTAINRISDSFNNMKDSKKAMTDGLAAHGMAAPEVFSQFDPSTGIGMDKFRKIPPDAFHSVLDR